MTVQNVANKIREDGNGSKVAFTFSFKIYNTSDIKVYKVVKSTGVATLQTLTTDYAVTINSSSDGGTVTYVTAPTALEESFLISDFDIEQGTDIPDRGAIRESQIEKPFDLLTLLIRQVKEIVDRCIKFSTTSTETDIELPEIEADTYLGWNAAGDALENKTIIDYPVAELASQADAEAGTNNTDLMTPLRTSQAISALSATLLALGKGADVASATAMTLGSDGRFFDITGTTTITSITAKTAGTIVALQFDGILTVTDGSNLKLNGNFVTAAGSVLTLVSDGTNWFEVSRQPEFTPSAANALTGSIVQHVSDSDATEYTKSTENIIANDDSAPAITEGFEILSVAITPKSATNKLLIIANIALGGATSAGDVITTSLHKTGTTDALKVVVSGYLDWQSTLVHEVVAGDTNEQTYSIRIGHADNNAMWINKFSDGKSYASKFISTLEIVEIKA